jgi:mitogen-activated protein kinase kinase kinase
VVHIQNPFDNFINPLLPLTIRRRLNQRFQNSAEYSIENIEIAALLFCLCPDEEEDRHFLVLSDAFMQQGNYIIASPALRDNPELIQRLLFKCLRPRQDGTDQEARELTDAEGKPRTGGTMLDDDVDAKPLAVRDSDENITTDGGVNVVAADGADGQGDNALPQVTAETDDVDDPCCYLLIVSPREPFMWPGSALKLELPSLDLGMQDHRIRLIADGPGKRLEQCRQQFEKYFSEKLECINISQAHLPQIQTDIVRIERSLHRLSESIVATVTRIRAILNKVGGAQDVIENWFAYGSDQYHRSNNLLDEDHRFRFHRLLMRLAINWIAFVCDFCDPTDRKTFRWAVSALEFAMLMTRGKNILYLEAQEFAVLRSKVATCMALLISHFDILGARGSFEAKKQQEVQEATRKAQRAMENLDDDYGVSSRPTSPSARPQDRINQLLGEVYGATAGDRSIRMIREARVRQIAEVDLNRNSLFEENRIIGQVLDEEVSEDRSLLFLASSSSNIAIKWQQGEFIGAGANGSVFKGFNLETGGIMAVKEIRVADLANTPALYKQIKDESDVMQLLSHQNIVDYYGIEVHRDRVYIFQEYCEGGSLANLVSYGRVEDEEMVMLYAYQMLDGLRYLHSKGVEHRDVKPDSTCHSRLLFRNSSTDSFALDILLGANGQIKFVDFGASKAISEEKRNATMNKSRRAVGARSMRTTMTRNKNQEPSLLAGTPMYMAPEVIKGDKSSRSRLGCMDIWSLGCVILELVTGRKPWSNLDNEW